MLLTAFTIRSRQPNAQAIGEYRDDAGSVLEVWEEEIERTYGLYRVPRVKVSEYERICESRGFDGWLLGGAFLEDLGQYGNFPTFENP